MGNWNHDSKVKCPYCDKEMLLYKAIEHEEACRKRKKLCDGWNDCKNKGIIIMTNGKEKSRWCKECFKRFKKENPNLEMEFKI